MRLTVAEILTDSFGFFFARLALFFHLVTLPWILSLLLKIATWALGGMDDLVSALAEKAVDVIPAVMFSVAWMRVVLLGPRRVERLPGLGWSARETAFLVHLVKVAGITFLLLAGVLLVVGPFDPAMLGRTPADPEAMRREAMATPLAVGLIVSFLLALRVSFGLAATAVDLVWSPRRSWTWGRGNAWPIIASLFVVVLAGQLATAVAIIVPLSLARSFGADTAAAIVTWTLAILVSYAGTALLATTQAMIFRRLTKWREGIPLA
jgi:hypothetical protein